MTPSVVATFVIAVVLAILIRHLNRRAWAYAPRCRAGYGRFALPQTALKVNRLQGRGGSTGRVQLPWGRPLTKAQAEDMLDWLEANGYPPAKVSISGSGFVCSPTER